MPTPVEPADRRRGRPALATILGIAGELLLTLGVLVLLFAAWQLWWTDIEADSDQADTVTRLQESFVAAGGEHAPKAATPTPPTTRPGSAPTGLEPAAPRSGRGFAVIHVPAFGVDYARPVVEGTGAEQLEAGIGHTPGTALPGQVGNFATAGHRVTYGKPYRHIEVLRRGDPVVVETAAGWSVYRYERSRIVTPDRVEVLAPEPDRPGVAPTQAWMTMVACHPPFSARERYVGYARLDRFVPRAAGPPEEVGSP